MKKTLLAIDQGTTGTTVFLVNEQLQLLAEYSVDFEQYFPQPGWVEHQPKQIWESVLKAIEGVKLNANSADIQAICSIGITNQRETICFWNKDTGEPLYNAIVWQDRRTNSICENLKQQGYENLFTQKTGLLLDPYFSATKIKWTLENVDSVAKANKEGKLCVGTIDSYLLYKLTNCTVFATEPSNASRTLVFNIHNLQWDSELCSLLNLDPKILPSVLPSMGYFGETKNVPGLPDGIPIQGILGDQQAALLGQACTEAGSAKCTYGTGSFILLNTGNQVIKSKHRMLSTIAWATPNKNTKKWDVTYALEGSAFIAGAAVQWLRDNLGIIKKSSEIEALANEVPHSDGVYFIPALTGLGAPYWNPDARGLLCGLTRGTTKAHIARATLEGIAFQNADILLAMSQDLQSPLKGMHVDGGASANNLLMQLQSDFLGIPIKRPRQIESTSMGAIFAAGIGSGLWSSLEKISEIWELDKTFEPQISNETRSIKIEDWKRAVKRAL